MRAKAISFPSVLIPDPNHRLRRILLITALRITPEESRRNAIASCHTQDKKYLIEICHVRRQGLDWLNRRSQAPDGFFPARKIGLQDRPNASKIDIGAS